jgi:hypothetical protein
MGEEIRMCRRDAHDGDCFTLTTEVDGLDKSNQVLGINRTFYYVNFNWTIVTSRSLTYATRRP